MLHSIKSPCHLTSPSNSNCPIKATYLPPWELTDMIFARPQLHTCSLFVMLFTYLECALAICRQDASNLACVMGCLQSTVQQQLGVVWHLQTARYAGAASQQGQLASGGSMLRGRFCTAQAQRGHSANYYVVYPRNTPENHPPAEGCMIISKQHGVQNSGPWDPWQASD